MEERKKVDFCDWLKSVPEIPRIDTNSYYSAPCPCGGTIVAHRNRYGHMRAHCNKCGSKMVE